MNIISTLSVIAGLASIIAAPAGAQDHGAVTRAQVVAELNAARASGELNAMNGEDSGSFRLSQQAAPSPLTRQQVRDEVVAPGAAGFAAALYGEDSGSMHMAATRTASTLTRAQVRAEVLAARASGELHAMVGEDSGSAWLARKPAPNAVLYAGPNPGDTSHLTQVRAAL